MGRLSTKLGPGLLLAAAAVGTSHLVQSTRAGAEYGLTFALPIVLVCLLKYPVFRFAAVYAAATGNTLIEGYARRGRGLVAFMLAPVVALVNQKVVTSEEVPAEYRPSRLLLRWNQLAIGLLVVASLAYLYLKLGSGAPP